MCFTEKILKVFQTTISNFQTTKTGRNFCHFAKITQYIYIYNVCYFNCSQINGWVCACVCACVCVCGGGGGGGGPLLLRLLFFKAWSPHSIAAQEHACEDASKRISKLSTYRLQIFLVKDQYS